MKMKVETAKWFSDNIHALTHAHTNHNPIALVTEYFFVAEL